MLKSFLLSWLFLAIGLADTVPTFLPVPTQVIGPPLNHDGYRVESYGNGAYIVTDNQYQALFFVSTEGVIVVDAPVSVGYNLLYAIGNTTHLPITHQVYSHSHADHIGASFILPLQVKRVAHKYTGALLQATPDLHRPIPDITFEDEYMLTVGNQTLQLRYWGPGHHLGNIFVYSAPQKVLMLVDIVFPGWVPYSYLGWAEDVPGFINAHYHALKYDFDHLICGHLTRSGNRTDVETSLAYVLDLKANCIEAFTLGSEPPSKSNNLSASIIGPAVLKANPNNPFAEMRVLLRAYAEYCETKTNAKYKDILAGTDVEGFENAFRMIDSLRLEYNFQGPFGM
jgi:glyoxylase-like metal-dependent hydrolase (beta-lactamase superfamily II)